MSESGVKRKRAAASSGGEDDNNQSLRSEASSQAIEKGLHMPIAIANKSVSGRMRRPVTLLMPLLSLHVMISHDSSVNSDGLQRPSKRVTTGRSSSNPTEKVSASNSSSSVAVDASNAAEDSSSVIQKARRSCGPARHRSIWPEPLSLSQPWTALLSGEPLTLRAMINALLALGGRFDRDVGNDDFLPAVFDVLCNSSTASIFPTYSQAIRFMVMQQSKRDQER